MIDQLCRARFDRMIAVALKVSVSRDLLTFFVMPQDRFHLVF